jgi:hypothetical protein
VSLFKKLGEGRWPTTPLGPSMGHEPRTEDHPNRYGNPSLPLLAIQQFKHVDFSRKIVPMLPNDKEISHSSVVASTLNLFRDGG